MFTTYLLTNPDYLVWLFIFLSRGSFNKSSTEKREKEPSFSSVWAPHLTEQDVGRVGEGGGPRAALQFPRDQQRVQMHHPDARQLNQ